jgi:hypothetical protein
MRVVRMGVEVRVMAGLRLPLRLAEVVGHEVHVVRRKPARRPSRVLEEIRRGARGEGEEEVTAARRSLLVQGRAQLRHGRAEVLLVLGPVHVAVAGQARVFPVHVEAVEVVAAHEVDGALHELRAALLREDGVREVLGPGPAPTETRIFRSGLRERREVSTRKFASSFAKPPPRGRP